MRRRKVAKLSNYLKSLKSIFGAAVKSYLNDYSRKQLETVEYIRDLEVAEGMGSAIRHANGVAKRITEPLKALSYAGAAMSLGGRGRPSRGLQETINLFLEKALELAKEGGFDPKKGFSFPSSGLAQEFAESVEARSGSLIKVQVGKGGRGRAFYYAKPRLDLKLLTKLYNRAIDF